MVSQEFMERAEGPSSQEAKTELEDGAQWTRLAEAIGRRCEAVRGGGSGSRSIRVSECRTVPGVSYSEFREFIEKL